MIDAMKTRILVFVVAILVAAMSVFVVQKVMRHGRDLIFRADDLAEFHLPDGRAVRTNTWYDSIELLGTGHEIYSMGGSLSFTGFEGEGYATVAGGKHDGAHVRMTRQDTTVLDQELSAIRVLEPGAQAPTGPVLAVEPGTYVEYWLAPKGPGSTK